MDMATAGGPARVAVSSSTVHVLAIAPVDAVGGREGVPPPPPPLPPPLQAASAVLVGYIPTYPPPAGSVGTTHRPADAHGGSGGHCRWRARVGERRRRVKVGRGGGWVGGPVPFVAGGGRVRRVGHGGGGGRGHRPLLTVGTSPLTGARGTAAGALVKVAGSSWGSHHTSSSQDACQALPGAPLVTPPHLRPWFLEEVWRFNRGGGSLELGCRCRHRRRRRRQSMGWRGTSKRCLCATPPW